MYLTKTYVLSFDCKSFQIAYCSKTFVKQLPINSFQNKELFFLKMKYTILNYGIVIQPKSSFQ